MDCPSCQSANPDDASFCLNCGIPLQQACTACGTALPAAARFCFNCGTATSPPAPPPEQSPLSKYMPAGYASKLEAARGNRTMEGERRIVTVLFSDVKGSTAMAGGLDPEEWAEIMNQAFACLISPIYRYEGTVARLMGDGILAFFGAPIAHEDDPQRAVLAGLEIIEGLQPLREQVGRQYGQEFDVRVGINTGLVVVGEIGSDLHGEYTAMGDAINLAARMEQSAEPGTVQIAQDTYKFVAPLFDVMPLGTISIKGKQAPVPAYRVLNPKAQPGQLRGIEGLDAPLVGRGQETERLQQLVQDLERGSGQIVAVMGEAGLGKSRLVAELRQSLHDKGRLVAQAAPSPAVHWLEGRAFSYESAIPYALFLHLFQDWFGLADDSEAPDPYTQIEQKIAGTMPEQAAGDAPFIASLLGIRLEGEAEERVKYLEPPEYRARLFQVVGDYLQQLATERPVILVFDDVHWADSASFDLLTHLLPLTERVPLMLMTLFRPRRQEPSWRFHEQVARDYSHRYTPLILQPLAESEARRLVAHLLHVEDLPEHVRALILGKSEGNPFYVEEVIRSLIDGGMLIQENGHWQTTQEIEGIVVPDTLAGVITARLDRLDGPAKRVVQSAAVIGRRFPYALLLHLFEGFLDLDEQLLALQRRELIREKQHHLYQFKHTLIQEIAYRSLLLRKRREIHLRVAEWMEMKAPEQVNEIAHHYLQARAFRNALPYLLAAGDHAARTYSIPEAIAYYNQVIEHADPAEDLPRIQQAYEGLGKALAFANEIPRAVATYETMLDLAEAQHHIPMQISALNKLSHIIALRLGQFPEAEQRLVNAEQLAREYEDTGGLSELFLIRCMMCTAVADFEGVERYMGEAVALGRELNDEEQMVIGLSHIANTQLFMTRFDEARQTAEQALRLARKVGDREHEAMMLAFEIPFYHLRNGDLDAAYSLSLEGIAIATQIGAALAEASGAWITGQIAHYRGHYEEAIERYERMRELGSMGIPWYEVIGLCMLGSLYLEISPQLAERSRRLHDNALEKLGNPAGAMTAAVAWAELGRCALAIGQSDRALDYFHRGLHAPSMPMYMERPRLLAGQAAVMLAQENPAEASALITEARTFAEEREMKHLYPMLALQEGTILAARGEAEQALERYRAAQAYAQEMGVLPSLWRTHTSLAHLLLRMGQTEEASHHQTEARRIIEQIGTSFTDQSLGALFIESASGTASPAG